jgi:hypothetical protein
MRDVLLTSSQSWFRKYNYLLSAALDGGSQVILFILVRFVSLRVVHALISNTEFRCLWRQR